MDINIDASRINQINKKIDPRKVIQKEVNYVDLLDNPLNEEVYDLQDLEELADDIYYNGTNSLILVSPQEDGKYLIICGHRRKAALGILIERGHEEFNKVSVLVTPEKDEIKLALKLVGDNKHQREKTDIVKIREIKLYRKLYKEMVERGQKINQPLMQLIAEDTNLSTSTTKRYDVIGRKLHPALLEKIEEEVLAVRTAYEIALMDERIQDRLIRIYDAGKTILYEEILSLKERLKADPIGLNHFEIVESFIDSKTKATNIKPELTIEEKSIKKATSFSKRFNSIIKDLKRKKKNYQKIDKQTYYYIKDVVDKFDELKDLLNSLEVEEY